MRVVGEPQWLYCSLNRGWFWTWELEEALIAYFPGAPYQEKGFRLVSMSDSHLTPLPKLGKDSSVIEDTKGMQPLTIENL